MTAEKKPIVRRKTSKSTGFERPADASVLLSNVPDVREDVVARGKALIADPDYPSKQHLRKVAEILAGKLSR